MIYIRRKSVFKYYIVLTRRILTIVDFVWPTDDGSKTDFYFLQNAPKSSTWLRIRIILYAHSNARKGYRRMCLDRNRSLVLEYQFNRKTVNIPFITFDDIGAARQKRTGNVFDTIRESKTKFADTDYNPFRSFVGNRLRNLIVRLTRVLYNVTRCRRFRYDRYFKNISKINYL